MARSKSFNEHESLDKAMLLFWAKGYSATSANDLVSELSVSRSSLYDTFGDKRSLFLKSLMQYQTEILGSMESLIRNTDDVREALVAIFNLIVKQQDRESIPKGCFMVNAAVELAPSDIEIAYLVASSQRGFEKTLEEAFERAQQTNQIAPSYSSSYLSKFFYNVITGLRVGVRANQDANSFREVINVSLSVLDN